MALCAWSLLQQKKSGNVRPVKEMLTIVILSTLNSNCWEFQFLNMKYNFNTSSQLLCRHFIGHHVECTQPVSVVKLDIYIACRLNDNQLVQTTMKIKLYQMEDLVITMEDALFWQATQSWLHVEVIFLSSTSMHRYMSDFGWMCHCLCYLYTHLSSIGFY